MYLDKTLVAWVGDRSKVERGNQMLQPLVVKINQQDLVLTVNYLVQNQRDSSGVKV